MGIHGLPAGWIDQCNLSPQSSPSLQTISTIPDGTGHKDTAHIFSVIHEPWLGREEHCFIACLPTFGHFILQNHSLLTLMTPSPNLGMLAPFLEAFNLRYLFNMNLIFILYICTFFEAFNIESNSLKILSCLQTFEARKIE